MFRFVKWVNIIHGKSSHVEGLDCTEVKSSFAIMLWSVIDSQCRYVVG